MIYTLTIHPSVDLFCEMDSFEEGKINHPFQQKMKVGGKGVNVSLELNALGVKTIPIVLVGGFTGKWIQEVLAETFEPILIPVEEPTRICVKWNCASKETALNPMPKPLKAIVLKKLQDIVSSLLPEDYLVVCGSGCLEDYETILKNVKAHLVLDLPGKHLLSLAKYHPLLVKPNDDELLEVDPDCLVAYQKLLKHVSMILHTRGEQGSVLITKDRTLTMSSFGKELTNTVGCGDAYLAGFLHSYIENGDLKKALKSGAKQAFIHGNSA